MTNLILAYEEYTYYMMLVFDINGASEDVGSVLDHANLALIPNSIPQSPSLMERTFLMTILIDTVGMAVCVRPQVKQGK